MAASEQLVRGSLYDEVTAHLRAMLVEGVIAPGAKLNERDLSERLKVSRTPLREAIKRMAAEGLVELLPNRGAVAVRLGEADVRHAFEVLAELEGFSGELAARRIGADGIAEIKALHHEMLAAFYRRELPAYYRLNAQIHSAINDAAGNPVLTKAYREINARVQALRFRTNQQGEKWQLAVHEHERMLAALEARDAPALRALLVEHVLHKRDTILELMQGGALPPAG